MTETFFEKCRWWAAIAAYIFVIYPFKYVIMPLMKILYENIYVIFLLFIVWISWLAVGGPDEFTKHFKERVQENPSLVLWVAEPIITIYGFQVTPLMFVFALLFAIAIYRGFVVLHTIWATIRVVLGHVLMISLWGWYTLLGKKEESLICLRNPDEKRSLIIFYLIVALAIILVLAFGVAQDAMTHQMMIWFKGNPAAFNASESLVTTANETGIALNISGETLERLT